jgi:hypothetical protein
MPADAPTDRGTSHSAEREIIVIIMVTSADAPTNRGAAAAGRDYARDVSSGVVGVRDRVTVVGGCFNDAAQRIVLVLRACHGYRSANAKHSAEDEA